MSDAKRHDVRTFLFSGYGRLPQDVSHQAVFKRVSVVVEVDERGVIVGASSTLVTDLARDYVKRLLVGHNVLDAHDREAIEESLRFRYRGHSQAALVFALRKVFEMVDQSPLTGGQ
jgi:hypothetical protein